MKLSKISKKYPALKKVVNKIQEIDSITALYPPQASAIKAGVLDGKNQVLSIPTASGKTLIAELAMLNEVLHNSKAVYVVPLRALANEKFEDMKAKYSDFAKIGISTGDFDSKDSSLGEFDILFLTFEKLDSLMRHNPPWLKEIGLAVIDEIHLLDSPNRGPTLEIVTTKLRELNTQILALSATIENSDELADWLDAKLVESSFRPIKLSRGVYLNGDISFKEKSDLKLNKSGLDPAVVLAQDIVKNQAQSLIFVNTRRGAEKEAEKNTKEIYKLLNTKEKKALSKTADQILNVLDSPTKQCKRLSYSNSCCRSESPWKKSCNSRL
jgi:helicase